MNAAALAVGTWMLAITLVWAEPPRAECQTTEVAVAEGPVDKTVRCVDQVLQNQTETPFRNLLIQLYPICKGGKPAGPQPVDHFLKMRFERNFPRPGTGAAEYLQLGGRKLSYRDGTLYVSSIPRPDKHLSWRKIGKVDESTINCAWTRSDVPVQLLEGDSLTLHENREGECMKQHEDDSLIPLIDDTYTKVTRFKLEIAPADGVAPMVLSGSGSSWYSTQLGCIRARGGRVSRVSRETGLR